MLGWGRWGAEDERGALNVLGAESVRRGVAEVTDGRVMSLAAPIEAGRGWGVVGRTAPQHYMVRDGGDYAAGLPERAGFGFADDVVVLPTHGVTHIDALSHVWRDGRMYNDHPAAAVTSRGARRLGVENIGPIVTRGVLVDAAPDGQPRDPGNPIHLDELRQCLERAEVILEAGDALLVHTGWLAAASLGLVDGTAWPGLDRDCAGWLAQSDVVLVGADNVGVENFPSADPDCQVPLHIELVRGHGIYLAELLSLGELAAALRAAGRATFLFMAAPLPLVGAVGSPVSPVAVL
jgi:kynurenine formamidase